MTIDDNNYVTKYLEYYCSDATEVDFAVLVNGKWGSGKTYLVNEFLESWADGIDRRYLRVSLYGLTSLRQVEDEFYRQLHPVLSSKAAKLLGKFGKGFLRGALKVDLDGDGKDDGTISPQIPEIDLAEHTGKPQGFVLVFDDLERCDGIPISTVLGFINDYVENNGFKAIILADEEKIVERDPKYGDIKEKLIGQTLRVVSNVDAALSSFLKRINDVTFRSLLNETQEDIKLIFDASETNNLRLLKRSLWLAERVGAVLDRVHWEKPDGVRQFSKVLIAIYLEVGVGKLKKSDLRGFADPNGLRTAKTIGHELSEDAKVYARYPMVEFTSFPLDSQVLESLLFDGLVHKEMVHSALRNSAYYADPVTEPAWKTVWRSHEVDDDVFEAAIEEVERDFAGRTKWIAGELLHVFGLRLRLAKMGAIEKTIAEVMTEAREKISLLADSGELPELEDPEFMVVSGWGGLGFAESSSEEFASLVAYFRDELEMQRRNTYPHEAERILGLLPENINEFYRTLCQNNVSYSPYHDKPVLRHIDASIFVDRLVKLGGSAQLSVFTTLMTRYRQNRLSGPLEDERQWLSQVKEELKRRIPSLGIATANRMKHFLQNLDTLS